MNGWIALPIFILLLTLGMAYGFARYQVGHDLALKRLAFVGSILAVSFGAAFIAGFLAPRGVWRDWLWVVFCWSFAGFYLWYAISRWQRRKGSGAVLLDLKRPRGSRVMRVMCVVTILSALLMVVAMVFETMARPEQALRFVSSAVFQLFMGVHVCSVGFSSFQFRERGLVYYGEFFAWQDIQRYEWTGSNLSIRMRRRWSSWWPLILPVASDQKDAVEHILKSHVI